MAKTEDAQARFLRRMQAFLTVSVVIGFFAVVIVLLFVNDIRDSVRDVLLILLGALILSFKEVFSYFMGSSAGSARKGEEAAAVTSSLIAAQTGQPVVSVEEKPDGNT